MNYGNFANILFAHLEEKSGDKVYIFLIDYFIYEEIKY